MNPEQHKKANIGAYHDNLKGNGMSPKPGYNPPEKHTPEKGRFGKMVKSGKGRS